MSYVNKQQVSGNRPLAIAMVIVVAGLLGYTLVTGLAYSVVKKTIEDLKTFDVEDEPPPPPEEPPPPPEQVQEVPPPVVAPPPIVRTNTLPPPVSTVRTAPPPVITPTAPPAPPAPPAPRIIPVRPKADLNGLIDGERDYPTRARRNGEEGVVQVRLTVGTNGRVTDCAIVSSSGSADLDSTTCNIMQRRARFEPATDSTGAKVVGTHTQKFAWRLLD